MLKHNFLDTLNEALNTLGAAEQSSVKGDKKKAEKLYSHAIALQPKHPKILVQYGLFIEKVKSDVLAASTFYTKAIILCPDDSNAKKHFTRTLPLVEEIDSQMLRKLDQKRERFIHIPRASLALRRLMRESYVEYIYHTVAMEGNTMNLAQTRSILETHMVVSGKSIMEHNEILGMDAALRFINSTLIHKNRPISIQDILEIHKRVFGFVDPLEAGTFRRTQVFIGGFVPCGPEEIQREMDEFIDWLGLESTQRIHPVELAALVHYKFIIIHPFIDGNGRTARILMNLILMRAGFPPVIVNVAERSGYYETLKIANDGDLRPFIRFIASCTDRTLETYLTYTTEISPMQNDHQKIVIEASLGHKFDDDRHVRS
uniref:protein adenylyltransferase n=1 Tax=Romanomermis culicivorax TaxID=13658 RepID=A0A915J437_ROMCU